MPAPLLYAVGITGASALKYGSKLFFTDPQLVRENASRYFSANPSTNLDQAPRFWTDKQSEPSAKVSPQQQRQQLEDARYQRSLGNQTGFDDEDDNTIDDKARSKAEYQQRAAKATNRKNSDKGTDTMATPNNRYAKPEKTAKASPTSDRYKVDTDAAVNLRNYSMQSSDRKYNTDRTADVNLKIGTQKNQVDLTVGLDRNAVTRDVGRYTSDNQLRASNYKTFADLQAALNRNQLQSGDNRFETSTKYGTQERMNAYNRNTLDKTEIAKEQIKAGTYGMSQSQQSKLANDKANYTNWKNYNDSMFDYAAKQNQQINFNQQIAQSNKAYADSRLDRLNDSIASQIKWQNDQVQRANDRAQYYVDQQSAREQQRADFNLRSQQVQQQIDLANREFTLKSAESGAKVYDIYNTARLKNDQFAATRADVSYNRNQQGRSRSNLAFQQRQKQYMQTEYNPAAPADEPTAIASPSTSPQPSQPSPQFGEGYEKALKTERGQRQALEKERAQLLELVAQKDRQLEQTNMTLEQKYQADLDATRSSFQQQLDAAIAEREAQLQKEAEARLLAEQKLQTVEVQDAARTITTTFAAKIAPILVDPDEDIDYFLTKYADNFAVSGDGQAIAIDGQGNVSSLDDLIGFFQSKHPRMFKAPAEQKTGGGYRNLANATGGLPSRQGQSQPLKLSIAEINANPKAYLENRDRIAAGDFETK